MKYRAVIYFRYALQFISLTFFIFLFIRLLYPLEWQSSMLQLFSWLDPWLLLSHLRWQHTFPVLGLLSLLTIISTLLLGRVFCGWLCPFGALLMLVDKVSRAILKNKAFKKITWAKTKVIKSLQPFKYYWLLFLAVIFIIGSNWAFALSPFALFSHEMVRILQGAIPWALIIIVVGTVFFSRLWCSVLCPTGLLLSLLGKKRLLQYKVSGNCVKCGKCTQNCSVGAAPANTGIAGEGCLVCGECQRICPTKAVSLQRYTYGSKDSEDEFDSAMEEAKIKHSRREFVKITITVAAAAVLWKKAAWSIKKVLRPPGALQEAEFTALCNRCERCIKVCPNNALKPMPITDGIECYETPQIIPRENNCSLCLACQEVCPTGAIAKVPLENIRMGTAVIDKTRCLAWGKGKLCFICGEQCPIVAIDIDSQNRPTVRLDKCVGCGTCEKGCPVEGESAIRVQPR